MKKRQLRQKCNSKRAQVWVETVIYTLIGLTIMGALIAVITPKVNMMLDQSAISQSFESLNRINSQISDSLYSAGNQRAVSLMIKKGEYVINPAENSIYFFLKNTNYLASQLNEVTPQGELTILTTERTSKKYDIKVELKLNSLNLTYQDTKLSKTLTNSPTAYNLIIRYAGGSDKKLNIDSI
ncbi:MAG: hypothetical protein AABX17_00860, partial [Nanoarchaeota archaeon]